MLVLGVVLLVLLEGLQFIGEMPFFRLITRRFGRLNLGLIFFDVFVDGFHQINLLPLKNIRPN